MKTKLHYNGPCKKNFGWQFNLVPDLIIQKAFNEWTINIAWLFWSFTVDFVWGEWNKEMKNGN